MLSSICFGRFGRGLLVRAPRSDSMRRSVIFPQILLRSSGGHAENDEGVHAAKHQVQHRVQEKAGIKAAERVVESIVEHASAHGGTKAGIKAAERIGERATLRAAKVSERLAVLRAGESIAERASERLAVLRAGERLAERASERAAFLGEGAAVMGSTERTSVLTRTFTKTTKEGELLFGVFPRSMSIRLGRRALIGLPVLGGFFATYICKQDFDRARNEKSKAAAYCFALATVSDALDAGFHFVLAYGLFEHWDHPALHFSEYASLSSAAVSIVCAIAGEIISARADKHIGNE